MKFNVAKKFVRSFRMENVYEMWGEKIHLISVDFAIIVFDFSSSFILAEQKKKTRKEKFFWHRQQCQIQKDYHPVNTLELIANNFLYKRNNVIFILSFYLIFTLRTRDGERKKTQKFIETRKDFPFSVPFMFNIIFVASCHRAKWIMGSLDISTFYYLLNGSEIEAKREDYITSIDTPRK